MSGTVEKAFKLLELMSTYEGPVRMNDLSRAAGLNKSTTFRMLEVLSHMGYVSQNEPNGRYTMTTRMWEIGVRAFQRNDLRLAARRYLEQLVAACNETAMMCLRDGAEVIIVEKVDCDQDLQAVALLGSRSPIHASSFGKAFLMTEQPDRIAALAGTLARHTERTITDIPTLQAALAEARRHGAAVGNGEFRPDVAGVAAPVIGTDGQTYASIGVSRPSLRMSDASLPDLIRAVAEAAGQFSEQIGYRRSA